MNDRQCEHFLYYCRRIEERISIINRCVLDGIPLLDKDIIFLKEIFKWYEKDRLPWLNKDLVDPVNITQTDIFD